MDTKIIFDEAKNGICTFFNENYEGFDRLLLSHFLNRSNDFLNYNEEGRVYKPKFIFTNNIDAIIKCIPKASKIEFFEDDNASNFNQRLKPIIAISGNDWCIYIEQKDGKINYGICKVLNSIKDKEMLTLIEESNYLKERCEKINCVIVRCMNFYTMEMFSTKGNRLSINLSFNADKQFTNSDDITQFIDATFSKLRTTKEKLNAIKTMYTNIFTKVINEVNGAICVVVDKEYTDNGFFDDGIWLKEPISFKSLFTNTKSYSEEKLQVFVKLFMSMLDFDGITVVDNCGRIRGYNIFVETDNKRNKCIVGGARKRAVYTILNSRRKHLVGVYFQSHEGEIFYKSINSPTTKKKSKKPQVDNIAPEIAETTTSENKSAQMPLMVSNTKTLEVSTYDFTQNKTEQTTNNNL